MPKTPRYILEEPLPARSLKVLPSVLHISTTPINYEVALIRLLTGSLNIRCNLTKTLIKQRNNYSTILFTHNRSISCNTIKKAIKPHQIRELVTYLNKPQNNHAFYKEIFVEFSNYFLRKQQNNEVGAFLHLYRILESIAYSFPLIWASRAKDYKASFLDLKKYFSDPKIGELGVFKKFVEDIFDPLLLDTQVQLNFISVFPDWEKRYYTSVKNIIQINDIVAYTDFSDITVKCRCLFNLLITLRNKYFHFLTGDGNNFNSDDIADPNEFFSVINEIFVNWLSITYFEILDREIEI